VNAGDAAKIIAPEVRPILSARCTMTVPIPIIGATRLRDSRLSQDKLDSHYRPLESPGTPCCDNRLNSGHQRRIVRRTAMTSGRYPARNADRSICSTDASTNPRVMLSGQPLLQRRWHQQHLIPINSNEVLRHTRNRLKPAGWNLYATATSTCGSGGDVWGAYALTMLLSVATRAYGRTREALDVSPRFFVMVRFDFSSSRVKSRDFTFTSRLRTADGEAKFWIDPEIELARNHELNDQDLRRVLQLIVEHEQEIRDAWRSHFGS